MFSPSQAVLPVGRALVAIHGLDGLPDGASRGEQQ